ncbi:MAG: tetratricopeptide repeat protein, partial [Bacteroidota bacterium]
AQYPDTTQVRLLNQLFEKYYPNRPDRALGFAILARDIAESVSYELGIANSLNNIGVVNKNRGSYDKALEGYLEALRIFRDYEDVRGEAKTLSNIGNIYSSLEDMEKALTFFQRADTLFSQLHDTTRLIGLYNNLGNVFFIQGNQEASLDYYYRGLELYNAMEGMIGGETPFNPYTNIGQVYFARANYDSALYYYRRSLLIERSQNRLDGEALALTNIGIVYRTVGNLEKSLEFHNLALEIVPQLEDKRALIQVYRGLVDAHFAQGDMFLTYFYLNQESRIKDSLYQEEADRILANIELNRLLDQQEAKIELLQAENDLKDLRIKFNQTTTILLILVIFSSLGVVALFYLRYRQKARASNTLSQQNRQIQEQNQLIEQKNKSIMEGMEYAKSLQDAVVHKPIESDHFNEAFVFHRPKDIVSGDFYFFSKAGEYEILAVADCTGHGVAGSFMTVIGNALLNQIVLEYGVTDPSRILRQLDYQLITMLQLKSSELGERGMDISICRIDPRNREITFSGAKRPLFYFQNGTPKLLKSSRYSIGDAQTNKEFMNHTVPYRAGDTFYLYSDGFTDQFGSKTDKKYMHRRFREFLGTLQTLDLNQQLKHMGQEIDDWQGKYQEQTDDMLVVGFRF